MSRMSHRKQVRERIQRNRWRRYLRRTRGTRGPLLQLLAEVLLLGDLKESH